MTKDPFEKHETTNGRWEILCNSTTPPHAIGAMSWAAESDVDFLLGHLNNAFMLGTRVGMAGPRAESTLSIRAAALDAAAQVHAGDSSDSAQIISAARDLETYLVG